MTLRRGRVVTAEVPATSGQTSLKSLPSRGFSRAETVSPTGTDTPDLQLLKTAKTLLSLKMITAARSLASSLDNVLMIMSSGVSSGYKNRGPSLFGAQITES